MWLSAQVRSFHDDTANHRNGATVPKTVLFIQSPCLEGLLYPPYKAPSIWPRRPTPVSAEAGTFTW